MANYFRNLRLRTKLIIILIASLIIFAIMVTVLRLNVFANVIAADGNQRALEDVRIIGNQFDEVEKDLLLSAKLLSTTLGLAEAIENKNSNEILARTLPGVGTLDLDVIDVVDLDSALLLTHNRGEQAFEPADKQELYTLGLLGIETTDFVVHELQDGNDANLLLAAVTAVRDESGQLVGALLVGREIDGQQLADINLNREDVNLLLIHDGQVIQQNALSDAGPDAQLPEVTMNDGLLAIDGIVLDTAVMQQALSGELIVLPSTSSGVLQVVALAPLHISNQEHPILMALHIEQKEIAAFQGTLARSSFFVIGILVGSIFLFVSLFTRIFITQPVQDLQAGATQMAEGHYDQRLDIHSKDEIGQLGTAFNQMASAIQRRDRQLNELNSSLELRVQERTTELEEANTQLQQEVQEREKAEINLRQQRSFLRQVLDINPSFIFAKDRNGRFTMANKAIADVYQTTPNKMIGKSDADFNPDREKVEAFLRDDLLVMDSLEDRFIPEELTTSVATGGQRWFQTLKRPIINENGRAEQVLAVVTDITERKAFENELAAARDQAVQASQLKTQLLANVSHDLRTPLNAVLGYIELLQLGIYGQISDEQMQVTVKIMESTRQLLEFVNNLLSQAQIESGEMQLRESPFAPAQCLTRVELALDVLAHSKGIGLSAKLDPEVPEMLVGSETAINQILLNLVSNAIRFTDQGSVDIHIYLPDPNSWALAVADTGTGIPVEAQSYIFQPFQQVDGSPTKGRGGSGLGLSIVERLTTLMGGEIDLKSELGVGSTFTIIFPLNHSKDTKNE